MRGAPPLRAGPAGDGAALYGVPQISGAALAGDTEQHPEGGVKKSVPGRRDDHRSSARRESDHGKQSGELAHCDRVRLAYFIISASFHIDMLEFSPVLIVTLGVLPTHSIPYFLKN